MGIVSGYRKVVLGFNMLNQLNRKMAKLNLGIFNVDVKNVFQGNYLTDKIGCWNLRYLWFSAIIYVSFSCQDNKTKQNSQEIGYSVDTVNIDSKDRILDLRGNLRHLTLDDKRESFFFVESF